VTIAIALRLANELEHVDPVRDYEYRDQERFDRIAYAMYALRLLSPPKVTVAIYRASLRLRVEQGRDLRAGGDATWATLGVPPHASRRQIALAVAELAGLAEVPYVVDLLVNAGARATD
jgi:hypothetical protein